MQHPLLVAVAVLLFMVGCARDTPVAPAPAATATEAPAAFATPSVPAQSPVIDASNAELLRKTAEFAVSAPAGLAWSGDGALRVLSRTGIDEYDFTAGHPRRVFETGPDELAMAVSGNEIVAVARRVDEPVQLLDLRTHRELRSLQVRGTVRSVQFFANNERVMVVTADPITATLWEIASGQQVGAVGGFDASASQLEITISMDGSRAAWMARRTLQFGEVSRVAPGPQQQLNAFVDGYGFSPDSSAFAIAIGPSSGVPEGRVVLWDPVASTPRLHLDGATPFTGVAFSPRAPIIASGGKGFAMWLTEDGRRVGGADDAGAGLVRMLSFSPDGRTLATVELGGTVRLWRVE